MISNLIEFSIRKRVFVVLIFLFVAFGSILSIKYANVDAIPDIGENQQIVFTEWPGRSPKDVEEQVTYPLSISLQGIPGVKNIRGMSAFGFSTIYIIFKDDVDFYWSRSRVIEKLSTIGSTIPNGVQPLLGPDATGLGQIYWYTLENEEGSLHPKSLSELRSIQDFYVRYLLQGVEGVSEVSSIGGFVKEYQIDVDPRKILAYNLHFTKVIQAIKNSNVDVGAEVVEEGDREMIVRGLGFFKSLSDIENVVVSVKEGTPVRVKDVARVSTGPAFRRGALDKNGVESVGGVVTMRFGENPKKTLEKVREQIEVVKQGLPRGVKLVSFYDRTELIDNTIGTVYTALAQEIIITIFVILAFLLHFKSSVLVSLTLPFGIGISFIFMYLLKIDSNVMSLSGMVIAIGSMVDMGIIMTENIYSHLAEKKNPSAKERIEVIVQAAREVGPAILTAVMTTIITFLPVFGLEGAEGKLFVPLAWAKTLAMAGAVLVAIVLVPALSVYFLKGELKPIEKNKVSTRILDWYKPLLIKVLDNRKIFIIFPTVLILLGAFSFSKFGKEFMPSLNEGDILYMPVTTPDVSMTKARELLAYTDKVLNEHPLVEYAVGKLGRADTALDPAPVAMFETVIKLVPKGQWPAGKSIYQIMEDLDQALQVPGLVNSWDFPIQTRIGMISTGIKTQIGVKIFGDDLKTLEEIAGKVGKLVEEVEGATGVYAEQITGKPYIEFKIDRLAASRYGINTGTVNSILQTAVGGMSIGQFFDGRERYPIRVRYNKEFRNRIDELKKVLVPSPLGHHIPLDQLADIKIVTGPAAIQSENGMLRSLVLLNVQGRDLMGFVEEAKEKVSKAIEIPKGYSIVWAGRQYENQVRANQRLLLLIPIALVINLVIIYLGIGSLRNAAIIFSSVPVAAAGGLILLWVGGFNTSVAVWVGFIALFGIAVDDGVVMMTYLKEAVKKQKPKNWEQLKDTILHAGCRRIRPLVMTTITTIVALLPVMWSTGTGSEVMKPMAIPTIGGMIVAFITLFVVPVIFSYFEEKNLEVNNV